MLHFYVRRARKVNARLKSIPSEVAENFEDTVKVFAEEIAEAFHEATPIRTGQTRNNMETSVGRPVYNDYVKGVGSLGDSLRHAYIEIAFYKIPRKARPPSVFFVNNVPWIGALEDGLSQQAPDGILAKFRVLYAQRVAQIRAIVFQRGRRGYRLGGL